MTIGRLIVVLSPLLFCLIAVPLTGGHFLVGKDSFHNHLAYPHIAGITSPGATLLWWVLISLGGYAIVLLGRKVQAAGERPTTKENRTLYSVLLGMVSLGWWLFHLTH